MMHKTLKIFALTFVMSFIMQSYTTVSAPAETVYICLTGKVYHSTRNCSGLANAKSTIKAVSREEAISKFERRACKKCY